MADSLSPSRKSLQSGIVFVRLGHEPILSANGDLIHSHFSQDGAASSESLSGATAQRHGSTVSHHCANNHGSDPMNSKDKSYSTAAKNRSSIYKTLSYLASVATLVTTAPDHQDSEADSGGPGAVKISPVNTSPMESRQLGKDEQPSINRMGRTETVDDLKECADPGYSAMNNTPTSDLSNTAVQVPSLSSAHTQAASVSDPPLSFPTPPKHFVPLWALGASMYDRKDSSLGKSRAKAASHADVSKASPIANTLAPIQTTWYLHHSGWKDAVLIDTDGRQLLHIVSISRQMLLDINVHRKNRNGKMLFSIRQSTATPNSISLVGTDLATEVHISRDRTCSKTFIFNSPDGHIYSWVAHGTNNGDMRLFLYSSTKVICIFQKSVFSLSRIGTLTIIPEAVHMLDIITAIAYALISIYSLG
ncbi:hypothetical protein BASA61_006117 [Batrachochytrium salamandrivorans]|nr:hypothetical protein BASA61_006117 [Batrachochytrium salamandrivorans]KAH9252307.1 hypothetical protein BASA81_009760 [Batrachochytrium salamandrivorans]KAH9272342.1 hypothetical protein BASA83_005435 [Batrachochytrium salamandrivorans]